MSPLWWARTNGYCVFSYCGDVKGPISHNSWGLSVVFFIQNKLERTKCFYINFNGKNCFIIQIFSLNSQKEPIKFESRGSSVPLQYNRGDSFWYGGVLYIPGSFSPAHLSLAAVRDSSSFVFCEVRVAVISFSSLNCVCSFSISHCS